MGINGRKSEDLATPLKDLLVKQKKSMREFWIECIRPVSLIPYRQFCFSINWYAPPDRNVQEIMDKYVIQNKQKESV